DMEPALVNRHDDFGIEHEVLDVRARHHHALASGQADRLAHAEIALDLLVGAPNGLHVSVLIDRTGHRQFLPDWNAGQRREQRVELSGTGAVTIDSRIGLFEANRRRHRDRLHLPESGAQKSAQDHHALVVGGAGEARFALDVDDARLPHRDGRGDPRGPAEAVAADIEHGKPVDLPDRAALDVHHQDAASDKAADFLFDESPPQDPLAKRTDDVRAFNLRGVLRAREKRRLARQIIDRLQYCDYAGAVSGQAHSVLDYFLERRRGERTHSLAPRQRAHPPGVVKRGVTIGFDRGAHLRLYLEQLRELGIVEVEQVVKIRPAQHDQLRVHLDRLRPKSAGRKKWDRLESL